MKATYKNFEISATLCEDSPRTNVWKNDNLWHNHFKVKIKNLETGKRMSTDYYGSHSDYQNGKIELDEQDLLNAFHNIVSDGHSGAFYDFESFCGEFGYDEDSRTAEKVCRRF